eukprot:195781_1
MAGIDGEYTHDLVTIDFYKLQEMVNDIIEEEKYNLESPRIEEIEAKVYEVYEVDPSDDLLRLKIKGAIEDLQKQRAIHTPLVPCPELTHVTQHVICVYNDDDLKLNITANEPKPSPLITLPRYQDIKNEYQVEMSKLLQKYAPCTAQSLIDECDDRKCNTRILSSDDIHACPSIKRISIFLNIYHNFYAEISKPLTPSQLIELSDCFEIEEIPYDFVSLSNDFQHVHKIHLINNHKMQKYISQQMNKHYPCPSGTEHCYIETRRTRKARQHSRSDRLILSKLFAAKLDDYHNYFLHSDITKGCRFEPNANLESPQSVNDVLSASSNDKAWLNTVQTIPPEQENGIYRTLLRNMGVFTWQSTSAFPSNHPALRVLPHIKPAHTNVKEEVLDNTFQALPIKKWNQVLRKAQAFHKTLGCRKSRTYQNGSYTDQIFGHSATWNRGESPTVKELLVLKLYTDCGALQAELKKCFRLDTMDDIFRQFTSHGLLMPNVSESVRTPQTAPTPPTPTMTKTEKWIASLLRRPMTIASYTDANLQVDILQSRLAQFYHWRGSLILFLHKFATPLRPSYYDQGKENESVLYHGVNKKMILNPSATQSFDGPLSTTSSYHVACDFADNEGMILHITSQFPRLQMCKAFDASLISDYPAEQEWLIAHIYLRVRNVSTPNSPAKTMMASQIKFSFFAIHLFRQQMFSLSPGLEHCIIPFIEIHLFKVSSTRSDMTKQRSIYDITATRSPTYHYFSKLIKWKKELKTERKMFAKKSPRMDGVSTMTEAEQDTANNVSFVLLKKFEEFCKVPNRMQTVKFDCISSGLKPYFVDSVNGSYDEGR